MRQKFFMSLMVLAATFALTSTATAAGWGCEEMEARSDMRKDCEDERRIEKAFGLLRMRVDAATKRVDDAIAAQEAEPKQKDESVQEAEPELKDETAQQAVPPQRAVRRSVAPPTFIPASVSSGTASRLRGHMAGITTWVMITDLNAGVRQHVSRSMPPTKVLIVKGGEYLKVRTSRGIEPFYADINRDGQPDSYMCDSDPQSVTFSAGYCGVDAIGDVYVAVEPGGVIEVLYLVPGGARVQVGGTWQDVWVPAARASYRISNRFGSHQVWARDGLPRRL